MALKAIFKVFGWGKVKQEKNSDKKRKESGDEGAVDQASGKSKSRTPRLHPYDDVSDAVLEENRSRRPPRRHDYDEVDLERTMSKVARKDKSVGKPAEGASSGD